MRYYSPVIIIDAGPMREKMARNATSARGWPRVDNSQSSTASTRGSVGWKMRLSILKSPCTIPAQQASEPCISSVYPQYTLSIPSVYTQYILSIPSVYLQYTFSIPSVYPQYTLSIPSVYPQYILSTY